MDRLHRTLKFLRGYKYRNDDDAIDRLSYYYSSLLLITFSIVAGTVQVAGGRIFCWVPAFFTKNHQKFTDNACWASDVYFATNNTLSLDRNENLRSTLIRRPNLYQWMPYIYMFLAALFNVPCVAWKILNARFGVKISGIMKVAERNENLNPTLCQNNARYIAYCIDTALRTNREYRTGDFVVRTRHCLARYLCLCWGRTYGNFLATLYLAIKSLYLCNIVGQLILCNALLSGEAVLLPSANPAGSSSGHLFRSPAVSHFHKLSDEAHPVGPVPAQSQLQAPLRSFVALFNLSLVQERSLFPRVVFCEFDVRRSASGFTHDTLVQCVLPVNLFNERLFFILRMWLVFLLVATGLSLVHWGYFLSFQRPKQNLVKTYLKTWLGYRSRTAREYAQLGRFVNNYLRQDGMVILRLVQANGGEMFASYIVIALWKKYVNVMD